MALKSKKEFADECGLTTGNLSNYIKRNNVVASGDFIDDQFATNADFLKKWKGKKAMDALMAPAKGEVPANPPATRNEGAVPVAAPGKVVVNANKEAIEQMRIKNVRERLEIEKLEEDKRYAKIKADKAEGLVMPTELVKVLFVQHGKSITTNTKIAIEAIVDRVGITAGLNNVQKAELRKEMIDALNKSVEGAAKDTKARMTELVADYSETRGRGERN